MIKNAEAPANGAHGAPNRLAMNRLGPQKASTAPPPRKSAEPNAHDDDLSPEPPRRQETGGGEGARPDARPRAGRGREAFHRDRAGSQRHRRSKQRGGRTRKDDALHRGGRRTGLDRRRGVPCGHQSDREGVGHRQRPGGSIAAQGQRAADPRQNDAGDIENLIKGVGDSAKRTSNPPRWSANSNGSRKRSARSSMPSRALPTRPTFWP